MGKRKASPLRRIVAENVRMERARQRLGQEQLAQMAEVSRVYMGSIERAESACSVDVIYRLAHALKLEPADLLTPLKRR
jgi:transcriptional regulator with XRE-family HTH domain